MALSRSTVLVTGAAGGMGRACARLFGATCDLLLSDVAAEPLEQFAMELEGEGYTIIGRHAGDLTDEALLAKLVVPLTGPFVLVHTAGLSPSMANWQRVMSVNLVATELLLRAVEPKLTPGSVAVLIASAAGHSFPPIPNIDAVLDQPLDPEFMNKIGAFVDAMTPAAGQAGAPGIAYSMSKRAVITIAERRAVAWGKKGARIVSISPGIILTPMGRKELAETQGAAELNEATPAGRSGTAMDIALAAQFLASDQASFITGSDLKVDGGGVAAQRHAAQA